MDSESTLVIKVLQIFYINGSQLLIADGENVINEMYLKYTWILPDQNQKITVTSPDSLKRYCIDTRFVATMVVSDPDDLVTEDGEELPKMPKNSEPWSA